MDLQTKRDHLQANLEQIVAHFNRTNGAIAVLDELIAEEAEVEAKAEAEARQEVVAVVPAPPGSDWRPYFHSLGDPQSAPREMPPVTYDAPDTDAA